MTEESFSGLISFVFCMDCKFECDQALLEPPSCARSKSGEVMSCRKLPLANSGCVSLAWKARVQDSSIKCKEHSVPDSGAPADRSAMHGTSEQATAEPTCYVVAVHLCPCHLPKPKWSSI